MSAPPASSAYNFSSYRGYTLGSVLTGEKRTYVAGTGSDIWFEADTPGELKRQIDDALAEAAEA